MQCEWVPCSGASIGTTPEGEMYRNQWPAHLAFTCMHIAGTRSAFFSRSLNARPLLGTFDSAICKTSEFFNTSPMFGLKTYSMSKR